MLSFHRPPEVVKTLSTLCKKGSSADLVRVRTEFSKNIIGLTSWLGRIPPLWLAQSPTTAAAWLAGVTGTSPTQQRGPVSLEGKERTRPLPALLPAWTAGSSALAEQPLLLPDGLCSNLQLSPTDFLTCAVLEWQHQRTYSTLQHLGAQLPCISLQS